MRLQGKALSRKSTHHTTLFLCVTLKQIRIALFAFDHFIQFLFQVSYRECRSWSNILKKPCSKLTNSIWNIAKSFEDPFHFFLMKKNLFWFHSLAEIDKPILKRNRAQMNFITIVKKRSMCILKHKRQQMTL